MMKIIDMTKHNNKNHYNGLNPKKYITIHQTGNTRNNVSRETIQKELMKF